MEWTLECWRWYGSLEAGLAAFRSKYKMEPLMIFSRDGDSGTIEGRHVPAGCFDFAFRVVDEEETNE